MEYKMAEGNSGDNPENDSEENLFSELQGERV